MEIFFNLWPSFGNIIVIIVFENKLYVNKNFKVSKNIILLYEHLAFGYFFTLHSLTIYSVLLFVHPTFRNILCKQLNCKKNIRLMSTDIDFKKVSTIQKRLRITALREFLLRNYIEIPTFVSLYLTLKIRLGI